MEITWISCLTAIISSIISWIIFNFARNYGKKFPPGPQWIPIFGNALALGKKPHLTLTEWARKYGNIFQIYIGSNRVVVLSDAHLVKEAFSDPNLNGRIDMESFHLIQGGPYGILTGQGESWKEQRHFTLKQLREFGFGKHSMEVLIKEEVDEFNTFLKSYEEKQEPVSVMKRFNLAVVNSLWMLVTGKRYNHDDPKLTRLLDRVHEIEEELAASIAFFIPWIGKLFPQYSGWNKVMLIVDDIRSMYKEHIVEHEENIPKDGNPRDLIDAYLNKIKDASDPLSSFFKETGRKSLIAILADLFGAGSETTYLTLSWAVLFLSKFQNVQKKLQQELDEIIGQSRTISLSDRPSLPYTEATIQEILRFSTVAPIGLFHTAMVDVIFRGYHIPKGTWICGNFYAIHMNETIWERPREFNPERFLVLDDNPKDINTKAVCSKKLKIKRYDEFVPFSTGKRICIGETFARDEIFLFLTNIFQRFATVLDESGGEVTLESKPGVALSPQDFKIILKDRLQ